MKRRKGKEGILLRDVYISITINGRREGKSMVETVEASGVKSICTLVDKRDWDAAWNRLQELGVKISYHKGRPVVNISEVNEKSKLWCKKHREK